MALQMNDAQRLQALDAYNPNSHLVQIKAKDGSLKDYLPAAYRFHELNLRYSNANFSTDLIFYDLEKNFCVVRVRLYLGADYELSDKKAESMKQGLFTALDKVETAAKARCCRDFGIGTEYALDMEAEETPAGQDTSEHLATIKAELKTLGQVRNPQQWSSWKKTVVGRDLPDNKLSSVHITKMKAAIEQAKSQAA